MRLPLSRPMATGQGIAAALIAAFACAGPAHAASAFDGSAKLICAVNSITACTDTGRCITGEARSFDLPQFIAVDFANKEVRTARDSGKRAASPILHQTTERNQLLLQGVENGHGWTMSIDSRHGRMSVGSVGEDVNYLMTGACINPKGD